MDYVYNGVIVSGFESVTRFIKFGLFGFSDVYIKNIFGFRVKTKSMNLVSVPPEATGVQGQAQGSQANIYYTIIHVITHLHEQRVSGSKHIYIKFLL